MKQLILLLILSLSVSLKASPELEKIRDTMIKSEFDKELAKKFKIKMDALETKNVVLSAYKSVARLIYVKHYEFPWTKYFIFKKETQRLDSLITKNFHYPELRFLRFAIQDRAPFFLNYNNYLKEDKELLESCFNDMSQSLKSLVSRYFISSEWDFVASDSVDLKCKCT